MMDDYGHPIGSLMIPVNKFPALDYLDGEQFKNVIFACAEYVQYDGEVEPEGLTAIEQAFFESLRGDMDSNIRKWKERIAGGRKERGRRRRREVIKEAENG